MIHALKIVIVHTKNNFHGQSTVIAIIKILKLPHGNFSLSTMATTVSTSWQLLDKFFFVETYQHRA